MRGVELHDIGRPQLGKLFSLNEGPIAVWVWLLQVSEAGSLNNEPIFANEA
ncbi:hypothetical protein GCM10010918_52490 [Paenibacillus radicis (ex Gao et al. 2016)]|uniref:Uncharacterized protein n=1 Tax=Paenibacillus radicis (ex Gao et al. 2016) TaxID=1737354 RepID=A0A917HSF7_9BACL|nr:hypothetical protein GCM10010918_52490 [Paenibacillus radicis (ex Gao et al. 2016)]